MTINKPKLEILLRLHSGVVSGTDKPLILNADCFDAQQQGLLRQLIDDDYVSSVYIEIKGNPTYIDGYILSQKGLIYIDGVFKFAEETYEFKE